MATSTKIISNSQAVIMKKWVIPNNKDNEDNNNNTSKWSKQLPRDIMHSILQRLCISDYLRCKAVCPSWQEAIDSAIASKFCRPAPQLPWLYCPRIQSFSNPTDNQVYILNLPNHDVNDRYVGSVEGWLIRVDWTGSIITLLNPVSGGCVMLPRRNQELKELATPFIRKVVASSAPTTCPHWACIVACLCSDSETGSLPEKDGEKDGETSLALCRPTDKSWTRIDNGVHFEDIEFIGGKLYAATKDPSELVTVFQFDINHNHHDIQYRAERLVILHPGPDRERFEDIFKIKKSGLFLAKDYSTSKELFMITFTDDYTENLLVNPPNYAEAFQVFKLEFNANGPPRWIEIVKVCDRILFLSKKCNQFHRIKKLDTNNILDLYLRYCIIAGLDLLSCRYVWLTPNPW